MDILLSALASAKQELVLLEGHALAARWKEAEFTDNVEAGLLRYGSSLRIGCEREGFQPRGQTLAGEVGCGSRGCRCPPGPF
eukprot:716780-Prorocentrum_minimum.AAC.1